MSTQLGGYMGKVLKVDLTTKQVIEYPWTDQDRKLFIGGKTMAAKILYDNIQAGTDPFSSDNYIVITTSPLNGSAAPSSSRFNMSTLSPLTGFIISSNCGGNFGLHLKRAGYDGLVITGKADEKTWLEVTETGVAFHNADNLWGLTTSKTQEELGGKTGKLVIGPGGENLVRYAGVFSQERTAGRGGVGAVMGYKNLKAVTATGTKKPEFWKPEKVRKVNLSWVKLLKNHDLTGDKLPKYGSAYLMKGMQKHSILATHNFKYGQYKDWEMCSGHTLAKDHLIKNEGCVTCTVQCARAVEVNGNKVKGPELETLGLLGPNLENNNIRAIIDWNFQLDELGIDTISVAGSVALAMELNENGLWNNGLEFGKIDNLTQLFEDIAYRRGIGNELAEGTKRMSEKFGGKAYAIHAKGLEIAAYEPRSAVGHGLGLATANRGGCHLNAGYMVFMEGLGLQMDPYTTMSKGALVMFMQNAMEAVAAAGSCFFPVFAFVPSFLIEKPNNFITKIVNVVLKYSGLVVNLFVNWMPGKFLPLHLPFMLPHTLALKVVTGMNTHFGNFKDIGDRGFNLERMFNIRMGLTAADDTLPSRLTDELQDPNNPKSKVPLKRMLKDYYKARGWDENGIPTQKKLKYLKLV